MSRSLPIMTKSIRVLVLSVSLLALVMYLSRKANPEPLGNRPLIVLGAGKRPKPPGTSDANWKELRQERDEQVQDLAHLSRNSKFILDPSSSHAIHNDNPQLVAHAIEEVLETASKGVPLKQ